MSMDNRFEGPPGAGTDNTLIIGGANLVTLLQLEVLDDDPAGTVDGMVWRTATELRANVGGDLGTITWTSD